MHIKVSVWLLSIPAFPLCRAVFKLPSTLFYPIVTWCALVITVIWFVLVALYPLLNNKDKSCVTVATTRIADTYPHPNPAYLLCCVHVSLTLW